MNIGRWEQVAIYGAFIGTGKLIGIESAYLRKGA